MSNMSTLIRGIPTLDYIDFVKRPQGLAWQGLGKIAGYTVRYKLYFDTSYPQQSNCLVEVWTPQNGWTEVWTVDPHTIEKCSGPGYQAFWSETTKYIMIELHREASAVLSN